MDLNVKIIAARSFIYSLKLNCKKKNRGSLFDRSSPIKQNKKRNFNIMQNATFFNFFKVDNEIIIYYVIIYTKQTQNFKNIKSGVKMLWFKMPKNLQDYGINLKHVGIICEIFYFANSKSGEIRLSVKSLLTKYNLSKREFYDLISQLCNSSFLEKGKMKGQYFLIFDWDKNKKDESLRLSCDQVGTKSGLSRDYLGTIFSEKDEYNQEVKRHDETKSGLSRDYLGTKSGLSRDTLTIDKRRVDKKRNVSLSLLHHYNKTFNRSLSNSDAHLKYYRNALKIMSEDQIKLAHKIIKSKLDNDEWLPQYISPANLFNSKTAPKRLSEVELYNQDQNKLLSAQTYLREQEKIGQDRIKNDKTLKANFEKLGITL